MPNKIEHKVSLSQLHYESKGIAVPRNGVDIFIPYEKIQLEPAAGCMLVHLAGTFKAELSMLLRVTRNTGEIEGFDIKADNEGLLELNDAIRSIIIFRKKIETLVAERRLTIQKARDTLAGLDYRIESDECLNQLLVQIVADFSPYRVTDEFKLPLKNLNYTQKGISFSYERTRYHLPASLVSGLELRARFNLIRDRMNGKATFARYNETLFRWDPETTSLVIGETKDKITSGHIRVRNPKATKRACYEEIIASFNRYKVRSIKRLERLLAQWGISPDDPEAGRFIAPRLTPLIEPNLVYPVRLKEIHFYLKRIRVPLDGVELDIPSTKFTFKTSTVFNKVKPVLKVFTNDIHVRLDKTRAFEWDDKKKRYRIGPIKYVVHGVDIDRYVKGQLSRIYNLHVVVKAPPVTPIRRTRPHRRSRRRIPAELTNEYIQALEGMAEEIYFAKGGYWFHVKNVKGSKDRLIWEVKTDRLATYIFDWPGKNQLTNTVQQALSMPRREIPNNSTIGYVARIIHPHGDFQSWKQNVKKVVKEGVRVDEVGFTAIHPSEGKVEKWHTLKVYAHLESVLDSVLKDMGKFEKELRPPRIVKAAFTTRIPHREKITIIPTCKGVEFNPESFTFEWRKEFHRAEFDFRADKDLADSGAIGNILICIGRFIIGTINFAMLFSKVDSPSEKLKTEISKMYAQEAIFISYSHKDKDVVLECTKVAKALGFEVLMDIISLRSGQEWSKKLEEFIERADIFQLFWSDNAKRSEFVTKEWQYALECDKPANFIRPVYWDDPWPPPPPELSNIQFHHL